MTPYFFELCELVENAQTEQDKIDIIRKHANAKVVSILKHIYDENIKYKIKKLPAYRKAHKPPHHSLAGSHLMMEVRKFYVFIDTPENTIPEKKILDILEQMCENISEPEVAILDSMFKKRKLPYKSFTKALVLKALPNIL